MPLSPEVVTANREAVARLVSLDVSFAPDEEPWFTIDGIEAPRQIGSDGAGGAFVLLPPQNVLYVSSEGRAGIIADTFEAFVQLVVARPYWLDILRFSGGGDLAEMRRAAEALEATLDDEDEINEARKEIRKSLDLDEPDDPIGALYAAIAGHRWKPVYDAVQPFQHRQQSNAAQRGGMNVPAEVERTPRPSRRPLRGLLRMRLMHIDAR
ncbi:hypothetical protein [Bradyrhizobium sp. MOS003]|uniref:hypothetical protein n=1 Tax=Bradyrhizobium sp. MOS003 TaxID=2133946 RepID=UPI001FE07D24|nr:hypothetical protein [Bradyrhizobium sp. MOS003]